VAVAGVPVRLGYDWRGAGFSLTHPVPFHPEVYEIERNLECLRPLGIRNRNLDPELQPPPAVVEAAQAFLNQHGYDPKQGPLIAVFPGGGVNPGTVMYTKRWTVTGYRDFCQALITRHSAQILLVGNKEDATIGDKLLQDQAWARSVIRSEGNTSLMLLAALLKRCALFIGGDSGPLHMANAVGIPTVSIFGPSDPNLVAPRGPQHRVIHAPLPCSPCYNPVTVYKKGVNLCQQQSVECMEKVSSQQVIQAAEELLFSHAT
jgi:ADP-heptose:LPS heptosyltransferase